MEEVLERVIISAVDEERVRRRVGEGRLRVEDAHRAADQIVVIVLELDLFF